MTNFQKSEPVILALFLFFLIYSSIVMAGNYYIDFNGGSDTNTGTSISSPWQHCPGDPAAKNNALAKTFTAGDFVHFKGGEYKGSIDIKSSGTNGNPITYDG